MLRFVWLALVASVLLPIPAHAQATPATQQGFGFCTVTDNSSAQIKIWASPVFPLDIASDDPGGSRRTAEVASEFMAHVGTLGGTGTKVCMVLPSQAEAAAFREEQRAPWSKRMYFIKIGDWRDVAWTPAPLKPGAVAASDAPVMRYFLCQATQMDLPDRSALSRTVASGVFARSVPAGNPVAMYDQAKAYAVEFQAIVQAHGLPVQGDCTPHDSAGEAQYAYQQMKRFADGYNQQYTEVEWTPSATATATVAGATAAATPDTATATATATAAAAAAETVPQAPAEPGWYCTAMVSRSSPAMAARLPVRKQASPAYSEAAAKAVLSSLIASVKQSHPGGWHDLDKANCYDNGMVFPGEQFCAATSYKRFGGGTQLFGLFCNASREMADKRWEDMKKADGDHAQVLAWPGSP